MKPHEVFARNVRERRRDLGLSQEELGARAGLHRTEIGLLERAAREPRLSTIVRIAEALETPTVSLLAGVDANR